MVQVMSKKEESFGPLRKLRERFLKEVVEKEDCKLEQFVIIPAHDGQPDMVQVVVTVNAEALMSAKQKQEAKVEDIFGALTKDLAPDKTDEAIDRIRADQDAIKDMFNFDD